jgi:exodeoxyribonuclease VII small subunit
MENKPISKLTYEEASKELELILENLRNTEQKVQGIIKKLGL